MTVKTFDEALDFEFKITVRFFKEMKKLIKLLTSSTH